MGYKDDNYSTKVCGHHPETCTCRDWGTKEEPKQELLPDFKITKNIFDFVTNLSDTKKEEPKRETLEEVAERLCPNSSWKHGFIEGAKWQQERSYSEEEVLCMLLNNPYQFENNIKEWFEQNKKK